MGLGETLANCGARISFARSLFLERTTGTASDFVMLLAKSSASYEDWMLTRT
jgi:hypothetical protein